MEFKITFFFNEKTEVNSNVAAIHFEPVIWNTLF